MKRPKTLPAFTAEEREKAHSLLATRVAHMMGRKFEEGDWTEVYCRAKGIPIRGWSNLDIDVMHGSLGVEQKMLRYKSNGDIATACGTTLMHPSLTRSFRPPPIDTAPNEAMRDVLTQYGKLIQRRREKVREASGSTAGPDMRTGWLLWQDSLRQFLYFEEEMLEPDSDDYEADWHQQVSRGGSRIASTSLWIFEKGGARTKRYSVTTQAGPKIQGYFDVPPSTDPNIYIFTVIGEVLNAGFVTVWLTRATARELKGLLGNLETETLSRAILQVAERITQAGSGDTAEREAAQPYTITLEAYEALQTSFPGAVSDEHSFQLLAEYLRGQA